MGSADGDGVAGVESRGRYRRGDYRGRGADFLYQRYEWERSLRMTVQEVKEEHRDAEGDPMIKSRVRSVQRDMMRKRMMAAVPTADVVVTNPTHLAVALKYDTARMSAPIVVAKGAGHLAERIRAVARQHGVVGRREQICGQDTL